MGERPAWAPDDIDDADVDQWADSYDGHITRIEYAAKVLGLVSIQAQADQLRAKMRESTIRALNGDKRD